MTAVTEKRVGALSYVCVSLDGAFDVAKTFDCGQCFRFDRVENSIHESEYFGIAYGRAVSFASDRGMLYIYNTTEEEYNSLWKHYLSLDLNYDEIDDDLRSRCGSEAFCEAVNYGRGIRILNQEPYEALISFIISQNNNIPRIKQIIERLSSLCGKPIEVCEEMEKHISGRSSMCAFPTAKALYALGAEGLFAAKTGFRAKYIYDALSKVLSGEIDPSAIVSFDSTAAGVEYLCSIKGVGPKVASCVLLFSGERYDAFPVDVWIKRAMQKYFPDKDFSSDFFGDYAGIAQQYLFYYERYLGGQKMQNPKC